MTEEKQQEGDNALSEIAPNILRLADFLDPHLRAGAKANTPKHHQRWSRRKALAFICAVSLVLWGVIFALVYYVYRLL